MTTLDELHNLMSEAANTPPGKTAADLWAKAAEIAEAQGYEQEAVICYVQLTSTYAVGGQGTRVIAPFIWCDKKFKERPDLFGGELTFSHAWHYKYVIGAVRSVPTVPVQQCESLLEEMRKFYLQQGDGMRAYHIRKFLFEKDYGSDEAAEDAYQAWYAAPESELSDCPRCDPGYEVAYYTRAGQWDKAVQVGETALAFEGDMCDSQPEALLTEMMEPWSRVGDDASAWSAHTRAYRRYQDSSRYLEDIPSHLHFLYLSGMAGRPHRIERGLRILLRHLPWWAEAETPRILQDLAVEGALLLSTQLDQPTQQLQLILPGEDLPWAPCATLVNPTVQEAYDWMRNLAVKIASMFDTRPGLQVKRHVASVERRLQPTPLAHTVEPAAVPDIAGLFTEDTIDYAVAGESTRSTEGSAGELAGDEKPLAPISLDTSWQQKSVSQLFQGILSGYGSFSSGYVFLFQKLFKTEGELPSVDELTIFAADQAEVNEITEFWNLVLKYRNKPWDFSAAFFSEPEPGSVEEELAGLLVDASLNMRSKQYSDACLAADAAMRLEGLKDPLGIRLFALDLIGDCSSAAGYFDEAAGAFRQLLNLYAALGATTYQAYVGYKLAVVLHRLRRRDEALEVLQTSLDLAPEFAKSSLAVTARWTLGGLYEEAEFLQSALREYQLAYHLCKDEAQKIQFAQQIAATATAEGEFQLAIDYQSWLLAAVEAEMPAELTLETEQSFKALALQKTLMAEKLVSRPGNISEVDKVRARVLLSEVTELEVAFAVLHERDRVLVPAQHVLRNIRTYLDLWTADEAVEKLSEQVRVFTDAGNLDDRVLTMMYLAGVHNREGRVTEAKRILNEAISLCGVQTGTMTMRGHLKRFLAEIEAGEARN
ncbi:tetratricopeptide repeat protein [Gleimia coleocanis DSM 15436]|uniref:Tetratricopeptide repeat protein n=1 Tax=Gleimia coleocanis DSM 15436 TaxID=525245 RepID=C0W0M4_9ACTO|nr:tetratricopeptide repeat protein [Gleimia coleocanis]EEH64083.1 tetratricopeptide repeat protein [Gleimia coleocanis DSM 15436]